MKLSKNFTLKEFTKSSTALRLNINNAPILDHIENSKALMENVWQKARDHFGAIKCLSGYRSPNLNKAIGGSVISQHCSGEAMDGESDNVSNLELAKWILSNCTFDQLILEFYDPKDPQSGWVHASYKRKGKNRNQVLIAIKENGRIVYKSGLG